MMVRTEMLRTETTKRTERKMERKMERTKRIEMV
jgi:hypothetical protein